MKNIIVTGAAGDIGRAVVKALLDQKCNVYALGRNSGGNIEALPDELAKEDNTEPKESGAKSCGQLFPIVCELTSEESVQAAFRSIRGNLSERGEVLDAVVHSAAISRVALLQEMSYRDWKEVLDCNLSSAFLVNREVIPMLLASHAGRILHISSVWGNVGASMEVAYSASKGGLNTMTRALARELAPSNIAVNALACGFVDTRMNAHLTEEDRDALRNEIPAGRFTTPAEVANAVTLFLQMPTYITGQVLTMDGAWT